MIVRILGEGQYDVPESGIDELNLHDDRLESAISAGDHDQFSVELAALLNQVRAVGRPLADDSLEPSELALPSADATLEEVRALLGDEGLIPDRTED